MKQTFTVKESRELEPYYRPMIHSLYLPHQSPNLFCLHAHRFLYTGWIGSNLVAAIAVDCRDLETAHHIRLSDAAYKDLAMLRGLIDRVLYRLQSDLSQKTTVSLTIRNDQACNVLNCFTAIEFVPCSEATTYHLPLFPFQKQSYAQWELALEHRDSAQDWLTARNQHASVLPGALPLSTRAVEELYQNQYAMYSLRKDGRVVGSMYGRFECSRLHIHELYIAGDDTTRREAISFLQQSFFFKLKLLYDVSVTITSLQPNIREALLKQKATATSLSTYTLVKELSPLL